MKPTKFLLIALCLMFNLPGRAQTIDSYFVDMPAIILPGLSSSMRLELTEYYKSEGRDSIRNQFGYNVHLFALDTVNGYISLQTASNARFEMKTLLRNDTSVVLAVIRTVCGPVCSSYIHFYDKGWNELKIDFPKLSNQFWIKSPEEMINGVKLQDMFKGSFLEYSFNPAENSVDVKNNSTQLLGEEEQELIKPFLTKKVISVKWKEGKWMQQNDKLN